MSWISTMTEAGLALLAQSAATSTAVNINAAKGGSTVVATPATATDITEPKKALAIGGKKSITSGIKVSVQISNANLTEGYTLKQIGIYGKLGTDGEQTLIAISQNESGDYIPSVSEQAEYLLEVTFVINYASTEEITVEVDPAAFATQADIAALQARVATLESGVKLTEDTSGDIYKLGIDNGVLYSEKVDEEE